jgi:hypothetical protein
MKSGGQDEWKGTMTSSDYLAGMQRDDVSVGSADLIADDERGIEDLRTAVAGLTPEQIRSRPIPGRWSTLEVVAHIADTEIFFTDRIERTIAMDRPLLMSVDERAYPERLNYQSFDFSEQLDLFAALRRHLVRILRLQSPEAWQRVGVHSEATRGKSCQSRRLTRGATVRDR